MKDPNFKLLFRNRHFVKLWLSQMLSQFSIQIMTFYILTRIFTLTESTIAVSLMWVAGSLPALIFGPFAGAIVDNFSRRHLLMLMTICQAAVIFCLIFVGNQVFYLYVIVFLYFLLDQLFYPSQQATAPSLVPKNFLPLVNGLFLITQQASIVVGFGLGGILLSTIGRYPTIIIASVNLLLSSLACYFLPSDTPPKSFLEKNVAQFFSEFIEGYRFVKTNHAILIPLIIIAATQICITIVSTSLPSYAQLVLKMNIYHASTLLVVPAAVGALFTTLFITKILKRNTKTETIQKGLFMASISLFALLFTSYIPTLRIPLAGLTAVFLGISITLIIVPAQSILQSRTPNELRGRVYGLLGFLLILATTAPLIGAAVVADILGVAWLMGILGLLLLISYLIVRRRHVLANSTRV